MPPSAIDFTAITHLIHFAITPNDDGTLDTTANGISPTYTAAAVAQAHAANKKILICIGGAGSSFESAASSPYVGALVMNLTNFIATSGYDGIDVDWEPLPDGDATIFTNFVTQLRAALNGFSSHKLLTIAVWSGTTPAIIASVQNVFNQINIMTYDLSGPYDGWVTWFNAPIYNAGITFYSSGALVPSVEGLVENFLAAGIPANELGIGAAFYGDAWQGQNLTQPNQNWTNAPTPNVNQISYNAIMSSGFSASQYHFDSEAQSAYYSVTNADSSQDEFIAFDDPRTCAAKVSYARNRRLGGLIIFELGQDHQPGQTDPLLQAIDNALATPGKITIQRSGPTVNLSFASAPLGSYQVQWSSNLTANSWNILVRTNLSLTATNETIQTMDSGIFSQPPRFYEVKTPAGG